MKMLLMLLINIIIGGKFIHWSSHSQETYEVLVSSKDFFFFLIDDTIVNSKDYVFFDVDNTIVIHRGDCC